MKKMDMPAVMYAPPEMFFEEKAMAERKLKRKIVVAAAVFVKDDKILAAQRGYGKWEGWWEFPGGKVESGEVPEETLRREIREEMDAEIEIGRFLETIEYEYEEFWMTMHLYVCRIKGDFVVKEHKSVRWLGQDELHDVNWLPADIELISRMVIAELWA